VTLIVNFLCKAVFAGESDRSPTVLCSRNPDAATKAAYIAPIVIATADHLRRHADHPLILAGGLDEIAHLATGILAITALARQRQPRFAGSLLVASVAIDIDHIPYYMGSKWLTRGTPRPYSHSLLTLLVVAMLGTLWRGQRFAILGAFAGLALHFWRDLCGGGVSLLWPLTKRSFNVAYAWYALTIALLTILTIRSMDR
jgi:inner membrane protein